MGQGFLETYRVHIQGLSNAIHEFDFDLGESFFSRFGTSLVSEGNLAAQITLDKHETFIESDFQVKGSVRLVCDRSLDPFDYPMDFRRKILYKFGHENAEVSDDVLMIDFNTETLEFGQLLYEFISLEVPMKKLHPRYEDENEEDEIIYSSEADDKPDETDPRWDVLKKLNKRK